MHKTLLIIGLIIVVALLSILYVVLDVIAPLMSVWVVIILASFALIFGFLLGIKYMSQI